MALTVQTNVSSLNGQRNLSSSGSALTTSMQRLSSGLRINAAKDDAAGLQISNRLTSQINGLGVAQRNANDGISMAQTAEGAMQASTNILQRMRDLSLQSSNGSNSADDRAALQKEVVALQDELTRISDTTSFGGQQLLDGSFGTKLFQVGVQANETINVSLGSIAASDIGVQRHDLNGATAGGLAQANVAAADTTGGNAVVAGTIKITGRSGTEETVDIAEKATAKDIALAINAKKDSTGVNADAKSQASLSGFSSFGDISMTLNGQTISATTTSATDVSSIMKAINEKSSETGVTATDAGSGKLILTDETGADIKIGDYSDGATGTVDVKGISYDGQTEGTASPLTSGGAADSTVVAGSIRLSSSTSFSTTASDLTLAAVNTKTASTQKTVDKVDLATQAGAQSAIDIIDGALAQIDGQRADLGAVQNRFGHTISNLSNIAENVSASRSRIRDTDFAAETATMTKNQILQQAGTSILAQANQLPQAALSLLG